jgi:hypothetical protein
MKLEIDLEQSVRAALTAALDPERVGAIINEAVRKTVDEAIKSTFTGYRTPFTEQVNSAIKQLVPHELNIDGQAKFMHTIKEVIVKRVTEYQDGQIAQVLSPMLDKLLEPIPTEVKFSDLVAKMTACWKDSHINDGAYGPTVYVEKSTWNDDVHYVYMDPKHHAEGIYSKPSGKCRVRFHVNKDGTIYGLSISDAKIENSMFVGSMYGFERYLFALYTGQCRIIMDKTVFEDLAYDREENDD